MQVNAGDEPRTPRDAVSTKWRTEICPFAPRTAKPFVIVIDGAVHELRPPCDCWPERTETNKNPVDVQEKNKHVDDYSADLNKHAGDYSVDLNNTN
jgi:hypothetical protein